MTSDDRYERRDRSASPRGDRDEPARSRSPNGRDRAYASDTFQRSPPTDNSRPPPPSDTRMKDLDDEGAINSGSNLFVTGIHPSLSEADITRMFEKYGDVENCSIMLDPHTKESRGFGFVKMVTSDQADAAKDGLQGEQMQGRTLSIEKARRGKPRTPTPGKYFGPPKRGKQWSHGHYTVILTTCQAIIVDLLLVVEGIVTATMTVVAAMDLAETTSEEVPDTTMTSIADHVAMAAAAAAAADAIETTTTADVAASIDTKEVDETTPMLAAALAAMVAVRAVVMVAAMHMAHLASAAAVVAEALATTIVMTARTALLPLVMSLLVKPTVVVVATTAEKTAMLQDRLLPSLTIRSNLSEALLEGPGNTRGDEQTNSFSFLLFAQRPSTWRSWDVRRKVVFLLRR